MQTTCTWISYIQASLSTSFSKPTEVVKIYFCCIVSWGMSFGHYNPKDDMDYFKICQGKTRRMIGAVDNMTSLKMGEGFISLFSIASCFSYLQAFTRFW